MPLGCPNHQIKHIRSGFDANRDIRLRDVPGGTAVNFSPIVFSNHGLNNRVVIKTKCSGAPTPPLDPTDQSSFSSLCYDDIPQTG